MYTTIGAMIIAANFTGYQAYGDRGITIPRAADGNPRIEATTDRGPIVEMIVRCRKGTAIISYSKMERLYCTPKFVCGGSLATIVEKSCG